jgi:hypothetical protein
MVRSARVTALTSDPPLSEELLDLLDLLDLFDLLDLLDLSDLFDLSDLVEETDRELFLLLVVLFRSGNSSRDSGSKDNSTTKAAVFCFGF